MNTVPRLLFDPGGGGLGAFSMIPAAAGVGVGIAQTISGAVNLKKDKAELSRLKPAIYKIQDEYYNNYNQAAELAQGGLTQGAKDYYGDMAGRGLGTGISGVLQAGGSVNDISKIFDSYNNSIKDLGVRDSEAQIGNIKYFQQVGKELAGQKTQQWAINEYAPYQNKLKELTQRVAADKQNIWGGITGAIGAGQAGVTSMQNERLINNLMKTGPQTVVNNVGGMSGGAGSILKIADPFGNNSDNGENYNRPSATSGRPNLNAMSQEELSALMEDIQQAYKSKE
jgi:hypothetical protein